MQYENISYAKPTFSNSRQNLIAGPNTNPQNPQIINFNHSPGLEAPMLREEGPLAIQGNIGSLVKNEALGNYKHCSINGGNLPEIQGANNCTSAFFPDLYTRSDTCGKECVLSYPESFGMKDFGFGNVPSSQKFTNAHGVHAYENIRAGAAGESSQTGCYEDVPANGSNGNTCFLDPKPAFTTVGNWTKLNQNRNLVMASFNENL